MVAAVVVVVVVVLVAAAAAAAVTLVQEVRQAAKITTAAPFKSRIILVMSASAPTMFGRCMCTSRILKPDSGMPPQTARKFGPCSLNSKRPHRQEPGIARASPRCGWPKPQHMLCLHAILARRSCEQHVSFHRCLSVPACSRESVVERIPLLFFLPGDSRGLPGKQE